MAETNKITLEELRAKAAKATIEATTFERTPTFEMPLGSQILFKVKKVVKGKFQDDQGNDIPLVIASDLRVFDASEKYAKTDLTAYTQEGKDGPKTYMTVKAGDDIRVPSFVARAAGKKFGIEFHEGYVYWAKYLENKKVPKGVFKVTALAALGNEFPE